MKINSLPKFGSRGGRGLLLAAVLAITAVTASAQTFTAVEAVADGCFGGGPSGHAIYLPMIDPNNPGVTGQDDGYKFVFTPTLGTYTESGTTAQLTGSTHSTLVPGFGFDVTVNFTGLSATGFNVLELLQQCYVPPFGTGGPVNPNTWHHYADYTGRLIGTGNFAGAIVDIKKSMHELQVGVGAAGKNVRLGASGWFSWVIVHQPTNLAFHLQDSCVVNNSCGQMMGQGTWYGDLNFNLTPTPGCTGKIGDFVWRDDNSNGCQDPNEPGIPNVTVKLFTNCANPVLAATTTTDVNGKYLFENLCAGSYTVSFTTPNGFTRTLANQNCNIGGQPPDSTDSDCACSGGLDCGICVVLPTDNSTDLTIDCGYIPMCTGKIGDFVWNDTNSNGCQDPGEPGIPNVTVKLSTDCANPVLVATTTTDVNGKYIFENLCAGSYTVSFTTPNGFTRTVANQNCNIGGQPPDSTDSDCACPAGVDCGICVVLPANNSVDLTIDCGYVGGLPCVTLTKTAASNTAPAGGLMTYTYVITNCGNTALTNLKIVDDGGTPNDTSDDFTVATGINLNPGESKTFTKTVILPTPLCTPTGNPPSSAGTLTAVVLPNGDIQATLRQSRNLNDNVYGAPAPADGWSSHSFGNLTGSDKAEFRFTDANGTVVMDFFVDYISAAASKTFPSGTVSYPAGYGTLGANGGDGSLVAGNINNLLFATTSLTQNLNSPLNGCCPSPYLVNSPTPEASFPNWNYVNSYTVIVSKNAFGAAGFGSVSVPDIHNSPAKTGSNEIEPVPCGACITNVASVLNAAGAILATDNAEVCVGTQTPPCMITPGTLKIDKKTVQLPLKNNGTADIFLSEISLSWNQATNGNLVKITLNGDVWTGSVASGATINSGFNADANKRKIAKGQTKTLVLTFANNASTTVNSYSGTIKFGSDASCAITFPPPTPPAPFSCDGHIDTLRMRWNGTQPVKVVAHYGAVSAAVLATIDNVAVGQVVTVSGYTGSTNDVIWEIFQAGTNTKIGESNFHVSCSDSSMDGPEDCGSAQGNGKNNVATYLNTWQFVGLTTIRGTTLACP